MPDFDPADPRWMLVQQIVQSPQFEKSPRLRTFLLFVCERVLTGHKGEINEQEIGVHVFGRSLGYNPGDDSIVRSQARILRQKLAEYFAGPGASDGTRVEIPKGTYVPVFKVNDAPASASSPVLIEDVVPGRAPRRLLLVGSATILVLAAVVVAFFVYRSQHSQKQITPDQRFWSAIFGTLRNTAIVPADSTLVLIEEITNTPVSFEQYQNREYWANPALKTGGTILQAIDLEESHYTSMADLSFVARLMQTFPYRNSQTEIRYARDLSVSDAREENLILIGGARANPWVQLFASRMNFTVEFDWRQKKNVVANKAPSPGESPLYLQDPSDPLHRVYGLVAFKQSLDGEGDSLLVSGTSSAGTQAAADFLLSSHLFGDFLRKIQLPDGSIPHFEILLEARDLNGSVAGSAIVGSRVTR